jgi:hypothetical protein
MLGSYLFANGARPEVLAQLSRFGLCIGPSGLQNIFSIYVGINKPFMSMLARRLLSNYVSSMTTRSRTVLV